MAARSGFHSLLGVGTTQCFSHSRANWRGRTLEFLKFNSGIQVCAPPWRRAELYGEPRVKRTHGVHQHGRDPGRVQVVGRWSEAAEQGRKVGSKTEEHARNKRKYREASCIHQTCIQRKQDDHLRDEKRGTAVRIRSALKRQGRSEEHTSELQSLAYLVCRLLLEKKNETPNSGSRRPLMW